MNAATIADFLGSTLHGDDIEVSGYGSLKSCKSGNLVFLRALSQSNLDVLVSTPDVLAIVPYLEEETILPVPYIESKNPRLDFIKAISRFFSHISIESGIHPSAIIEPGADITDDVSIGAGCYIGPHVKIGSGTVLMPNVSIYGDVTMGKDCYIKAGAVIGDTGDGFEYDEDGVPIYFPHSGRVIIGNNVYIGANTVIDRATIDATIIEDNVKIANLTHIPHNCIIGRNTIITSCVALGGGDIIGHNSWLAPNTTLYQHLVLGDNCKIGIGAVVLKNVDANQTVFGNPARKVIKND